MEIGDYIKELRMSKKISQKQLAKKIHMDPSTLCKIEKNSTSPSYETVCIILQELGEIDFAIESDSYILSPSLSRLLRYLESLPPHAQENFAKIAEPIAHLIDDNSKKSSTK